MEEFCAETEILYELEVDSDEVDSDEVDSDEVDSVEVDSVEVDSVEVGVSVILMDILELSFIIFWIVIELDGYIWLSTSIGRYN